MPIEHEFLSSMVHTITVRKASGVSSYGVATTGAGTQEYPCRIVYKERMFRRDDGQEVTTRGKVYIFGSPGITTKDEITFPDGTKPKMVYIESYPDDDGDHHQVLNFA